MRPQFKIRSILMICSIYFLNHTSAQTWQWANSCGGPMYDYAVRLSLDKSDNLYLLGKYFMPYATFGDTTLSTNGNYDVFVSKLDRDGNFLWTVSGGGYNPQGGNEEAWDMYYEKISNSVIVTGTMEGSSKKIGGCSLGQTEIIFLTKLDSSGKCVWATHQADLGNTSLIYICPDDTGNIYMVGNTENIAYFNNVPVPAGGFLAKFKSSKWCHCLGKKYF